MAILGFQDGAAQIVEFGAVVGESWSHHMLYGHGAPISAVAIADFKHDLAVTAACDQRVHIWSAHRGLIVGSLPYRGIVLCLALTRDAAWLVTGADSPKLEFWPLANVSVANTRANTCGERVAVFSPRVYPKTVALAPDDRTLVVKLNNAEPVMWRDFNPATFDQRKGCVVLLGHANVAVDIAVSPAWCATTESTRILLFAVRGGSVEYEVPRYWFDTPSMVTCLAWVPPAYRALVSGHNDGGVRVLRPWAALEAATVAALGCRAWWAFFTLRDGDHALWARVLSFGGPGGSR
jgi:hypothetical protein